MKQQQQQSNSKQKNCARAPAAAAPSFPSLRRVGWGRTRRRAAQTHTRQQDRRVAAPSRAATVACTVMSAACFAPREPSRRRHSLLQKTPLNLLQECARLSRGEHMKKTKTKT